MEKEVYMTCFPWEWICSHFQLITWFEIYARLLVSIGEVDDYGSVFRSEKPLASVQNRGTHNRWGVLLAYLQMTSQDKSVSWEVVQHFPQQTVAVMKGLGEMVLLTGQAWWQSVSVSAWERGWAS